MAMPFMRAASKTLVPAGTRKARPSIVTSIIPGGVVAVVILRADSYALGFTGARSGGKANPAGTLAPQNVRINFSAEMLQHGLNGGRRDLAEAADRSLAHGLCKIIEQGEIGAILRLGDTALCPTREQIRHFLRSNAAGNALAAGFVAIKAHGIERHVQDAGSVVANDDGTRTEHRPGIGEGFEVQTNVYHRCRKITGGGTGRRESFHLTAAANPAGVIENDFAQGSAHGDLENAGAGDVAADADKFQPPRTVGALRDERIDAARKNLRNIDECFHIVDDRWFLPQAHLAGERRLIAGLGAMAFDGFDECALLAADVAAGANKHLEIVPEIAAKDCFSKQTGAITAANLFAENFFLKMILVADIDDTALCARDQACDDHAFDDQMR